MRSPSSGGLSDVGEHRLGGAARRGIDHQRLLQNIVRRPRAPKVHPLQRLLDGARNSEKPNTPVKECADGDLVDINPNSETVLDECLVEPMLAELPVGETVQFERLGYFCPDPDSTPERLVFNRTLGLRDSWARVQAQGQRS